MTLGSQPDGAPERRRPSAWQLAVIAAYVAALALLIPRHEPWFDEAQAWLLARDAPLLELYMHLLRYEGNPGLWHTLLLVPARLGASYEAMAVLSGALGVAGTALFVLRAPFPPWVRAAFPFTYFPLYQYSVVARSYSLAPPILFCLAALWPERLRRPAAFAALLALLAGVSVHGLLMAGALAALHVREVAARRAQLGREQLRSHVLAMIALLGLGVALVLLGWQPADHMSEDRINQDPAQIVRIALWMMNGPLTEIGLLSLAVGMVSLVWLRSRGALATFALPAAAVVVFAALRSAHPWHEGMLVCSGSAARRSRSAKMQLSIGCCSPRSRSLLPYSSAGRRAPPATTGATATARAAWLPNICAINVWKMLASTRPAISPSRSSRTSRSTCSTTTAREPAPRIGTGRLTTRSSTTTKGSCARGRRS